MPSRKRESERKGNPPVSTGPSPFSDECPNSAVEELNEPARGSGSLQRCVMENDVDEEIFKLLDCMNEQIHLKLILERKMKECWMAMAKARESMGSLLNISVVNLDSTSTVDVEKGVHFILRQRDDDFSRKQMFKKFGLFTPIHLVTAQKHSIAAINLVCNIASNQTQLVQDMAKYAEHDLKRL
ncbi:hypothetical protein T03_5098 [Trichinella britovi]|uniref:Uncharacterized protein n=1 Tax=Trichinella britovi TaxID=45882 RepID=A0A0V1CU51_TRIBR|nr:hypothetical protein T03_5098 [Trichinella britovi]